MTARVMSGDMVRRPRHTVSGGGWWLLVTEADSVSFTGRWCRTGSTVATLRASAVRWPQDGNYSRLSMISESR
tara:strand:+ start:310 stop:528 length:219 start_codon:yes stop_codon:yes gene_type:complete